MMTESRRDAEHHDHSALSNGIGPSSVWPRDDDDENDDDLGEYDLLIELDRLEELIETMDELGVATRDELELLPASPDSVQLLHELDTLQLKSRAEIEARIAELEASLDDDG